MSVSTPPAAGPVKRTLPLLDLLGLVALAAIGGVLIGGWLKPERSVRPVAPVKTHAIAHQGLSVQPPSAWAPAEAPAIAGFSHPLGVRDAKASVRATVELLPVLAPTLLPPALSEAVGGASARPEILRLSSGAWAWRYSDAQNPSAPVVIVTPTTKGIATVGCVGGGSATAQACAALAGGVAVPGARRLAPSHAAAFFVRAPSTLTDLNRVRESRGGDLTRARRAAAQAAAADDLARAHRTAATALFPFA